MNNGTFTSSLRLSAALLLVGQVLYVVVTPVGSVAFSVHAGRC